MKKAWVGLSMAMTLMACRAAPPVPMDAGSLPGDGGAEPSAGSPAALVIADEGPGVGSRPRALELEDLDAGSAPAVLLDKGHAGDLRDLAFSRDGAWLATASADHTIRVWHSATRVVVATLATAGHAVAIAVSNRSVAIVQSDGTLQVWNWPGTAAPLESKVPQDPNERQYVQQLTFLDEQHLVGLGPGVRCTWELPALAQSQRCEFSASPAYQHAVLDLNMVLLSWGELQASNLYSTQSNSHELRVFSAPPASRLLRTVAGMNIDTRFALGPGVLAIADGASVRLISVANGSERRLAAGGPGELRALAFAPDGRSLVAARYDEKEDAMFLDRLPLAGGKVSSVRQMDIELRWTERVRWSPDGKQLVFARMGGMLRFVDAATLTSRPVPGPGEVIRASLSPDGRALLIESAAADGPEVRLWRLDEPGEPRPVSAPYGVLDAALGSTALVLGGFSTARALEPRTLGEIARIPTTHQVWAVAVAGNQVALGEKNGVLALWQPRTGTSQELAAHDEAVAAVALSPDGSRVASASRKVVKVWDVRSGKPLLELPPVAGSITALAFAGERLLVAGTESGERGLQVYASRDGKLLATLHPIEGGIERMVVLDEHRAVVAGADGVVRVLELEDGAELARLPLPGKVRSLSADRGARLLAISAADGTAWLVAAANLHPRARIAQSAGGWLVAAPDGRYEGTPSAVADTFALVGRTPVPVARSPENRSVPGLLPSLLGFTADTSGAGSQAPAPALVVQVGDFGGVHSLAQSRDGRVLATIAGVNAGTVLKVWDLGTGKLLRSRQVQGEAVAVSPDGTRLALWGIPRSSTALLDSATLQVLREIPCAGGEAVFHPDGKRLVVLQGDRAEVRDVEGGQVLFDFALGMSANSPTLSSDGRTLFVFGFEGLVAWYDLSTGTRRGAAQAHDPSEPFNANVLRVSPRGDVVAACDGFHVRIFDVATGARRHDLQVKVDFLGTPELKVVSDLAFSTDGRQLAGGLSTGPVVIWDVASGREVKRLGEAYAVNQLRYGPEGATLVAASNDGLSRFDLARGARLETFGRKLVAGAVAPSPGDTALLVDVGDARLWEARRGISLRPADDTHPSWDPPHFSPGVGHDDFAWSGDATVVAIANTSGVVVRDVATGTALLSVGGSGTAEAEMGPFEHVTLDRSGARVAFVTLGPSATIQLWDVAQHARVWEAKVSGAVPNSVGGTLATALRFRPDGKVLVLGSDTKQRGVTLIDAATGNTLTTVAVPGVNGVRDLAFSPDGALLAVADATSRPLLLDGTTGAARGTLAGHEARVVAVAFSPDGTELLTGGADARVVVWDPRTRLPRGVLEGHDGAITRVGHTGRGELVVTAGEDGTIKLWKRDGALVATLVFAGEELLIADAAGHYFASRGALDAVGFRVGAHAFPVEQFDAFLDRPDLVLGAIGGSPPELLVGLERAWQRRLRRLGLATPVAGATLELPVAEIASSVPLVTHSRKVSFTVHARARVAPLARLQVFVNDVPIDGSGGRPLRALKELTEAVTLELGSGTNKVQVSVLDANGVESLRETRQVNLVGPAPKPRLFVVTIGVSHFKDKQHDLAFAAKDARDIAEHFAKVGSFSAVDVQTLVDEQVTARAVSTLRAKLTASSPDDLVVVFLAGHGLLDDKGEFYFATWDTDFTHPAGKGLPFVSLEALLDGIGARHKLLLVDACHSGERDVDELALGPGAVPAGVVIRGLAAGGSSQATRQSSSRAVVPELFADLRRGSGAVVIAASAAAEYALESTEWNNGVFTSALLEGLGSARADRNGDHSVQVSELRTFVLERVRELTRGRQTPTTRRENLAADFIVP